MRSIILTTFGLLLISGTALASDIQPSTLEAPNPGALQMFEYVPEGLPKDASLVVVLHGCAQNADAYVSLAGWQTLADEHGFALLAPGQSGSNNVQGCFNWFESGDNSRDQGEAQSIRNMVAQLVGEHDLDEARVFVTGLSAGGYMTTVLLAVYPEVFAAGAVVAGGPYGCADSVTNAFSCMGGSVSKDASEWARLVTTKSSHEGDFPRLSIWHGDADYTVSKNNADELVKQWTELHGLSTDSVATDEIAGHQRQRYGSPASVELVTLGGMGHAVPVDPSTCGSVGAFASDVDVCSSLEIARFWGIEDGGSSGGGGADGGPGDGTGPGDGMSGGTGGCGCSVSAGNRASSVLLCLVFALLFFRKSAEARR